MLASFFYSIAYIWLSLCVSESLPVLSLHLIEKYLHECVCVCMCDVCTHMCRERCRVSTSIWNLSHMYKAQPFWSIVLIIPLLKHLLHDFCCIKFSIFIVALKYNQIWVWHTSSHHSNLSFIQMEMVGILGTNFDILAIFLHRCCFLRERFSTTGQAVEMPLALQILHTCLAPSFICYPGTGPSFSTLSFWYLRTWMLL